MIVFHNADKEFHEKIDKKNLANLPHPFRLVIGSAPNSGKTNLIKNLIIHQKPNFDRIILWHIDPETSEYDDIDVEKTETIPEIKDIDKKKKNLLVIEDVDIKSIDKKSKSILDRFFGYASTHKNLSVILTAQRLYNVPVSLRSTCSHLILWKNSDAHFIRSLADLFGLKHEEVKMYILLNSNNCHDSFIFDRTGGPVIRKNLFEILKE